MIWRTFSIATITGLLVLIGSRVSADNITFYKIAETGTPAPGQGAFSTFGPVASISGNNVAFVGNFTGGDGVYTGTVGTTGAVKIVDTSDTAPGHLAFVSFSRTTISGNNVAFLARYSDSNFGDGDGVYTGTLGSTGATKIVDVKSGKFDFPYSGPFANGNNVAFSFDSITRGIYIGTAGTAGATKIVDDTDNAPGHGPFTSFGPPTLSGNNIAFYGGYGDVLSTGEKGSGGIYTGVVGQTGASKIVDKGDGVFTSLGTPSVSGNKVYFSGTFNGGSGIYVGDVGVAGATKIVDTNDTAPGGGTFENFSNLSASGDRVVFAASHTFGNGIYLWSGSSMTKVIETGDALFGGTVLSLISTESAFDNNKVAFWYIRTGAYGIGVAEINTVPEPASFVLAGLAFLTLGCIAWRKRNRVLLFE